MTTMTTGKTKPLQIEASRITSEAEALGVARTLAARFAIDASARDRERRLPYEEVDAFSRSGLWAITVPTAFGGLDASDATIAAVIAIISGCAAPMGGIIGLRRTAGSTKAWTESR